MSKVFHFDANGSTLALYQPGHPECGQKISEDVTRLTKITKEKSEVTCKRCKKTYAYKHS